LVRSLSGWHSQGAAVGELPPSGVTEKALPTASIA
jgi:hypothetical protein